MSERVELVSQQCIAGPDGRCLTCADEALPGRVVAVDAALALALVEVADERLEIAIDLLDDVALGEIVLVHGGVAIARLEAEP